MTAFVKRGTREEVGVVTDYVDSQYAKPPSFSKGKAGLKLV